MSGPRDLVAYVIAAAASRLGDDATPVLSRLAGPCGDRARAAARELAQLDEPARKQRRAEVAALARTPVAATRMRGIHPTWFEAALTALPPRARTALAGGSIDPIDVWLARWATASLLGSDATITPGTLAAIIIREPTQILAWLTSIALDQLAFALGAGAAASPSAALRDAATRIATPPRLNALGPQRAALLRCRGAALDDPSALLTIAGRVLSPHLTNDPLARLQLTRRLPHAAGIVVERELAAGAATPIDQVPSWAALLAP